ncbi:MAG: hypothetical protein GY951_13075 [Psychromonas sp.]|nr:hypothetical protein [Psychromonas sp.]
MSGAKFGFIHSVKGGKWLVVLVFLGSGEIRGPFDTEEQAKEAAEQAVIDWFEGVLE